MYLSIMYQINKHTHTHTHTHRHTEEHALQMLFIYFPFRDENELKYSDS